MKAKNISYVSVALSTLLILQGQAFAAIRTIDKAGIIAHPKSAQVTKKTQKRQNSLQQTSCNEPQPISQAGIVIDTPGFYCVTEDLTFGAGQTAAITVASDGVTIDFNGHTLTLTNNTSTGIFALNVTHLSILNGVIANEPANIDGAAAAINFDGVQQGYIDNFTLRNNFIGLLVENARDIRVTHLFADNAFGANIRIGLDTIGFVLSDSTLRNDTNIQLGIAGISVGRGVSDETPNINRDITFENLELFNTDIFFAANLNTGIRLNNITSIVEDPDYIFSSLQFGSNPNPIFGSARATDILLTNSSFTNTLNTNESASGILAINAENLHFENLVISNAAHGDQFVAGVALGIANFDVTTGTGADTAVRNLLLKDSILTGGNRTPLTVNGSPDDQTRGITIENTSISDGQTSLVEISQVHGIVFKNDKFLNTPGAALIVGPGVVGLALVDNVFLNIGGATLIAPPGTVITTSGNVQNNNAQVCFDQVTGA